MLLEFRWLPQLIPIDCLIYNRFYVSCIEEKRRKEKHKHNSKTNSIVGES